MKVFYLEYFDYWIRYSPDWGLDWVSECKQLEYENYIDLMYMKDLW